MIRKGGMGRIKADMILITQGKNNFIKVKNHPFSFWSTQKQIKEKKLSNYMAKNEKFQSFFLICLLFSVFFLFVIILSQKFQPVKALEKLPWVTFSLIFNIQKKKERRKYLGISIAAIHGVNGIHMMTWVNHQPRLFSFKHKVNCHE